MHNNVSELKQDFGLSSHFHVIHISKTSTNEISITEVLKFIICIPDLSVSFFMRLLMVELI